MHNGPNRNILSKDANSHADWDLDPLGYDRGGSITVDRVAIVRIACVAAETGARMQRDALAVDPVGWMLTPHILFEGRAPIDACMEREACSRAILLHGLSLDLDVDPEKIGHIIAGSAGQRQLEVSHD